jgi:hypothetical protein
MVFSTKYRGHSFLVKRGLKGKQNQNIQNMHSSMNTEQFIPKLALTQDRSSPHNEIVSSFFVYRRCTLITAN